MPLTTQHRKRLRNNFLSIKRQQLFTFCFQILKIRTPITLLLVMIRYDIYLLTAIVLTPGGSCTVHIYTQTIHRKTQSTQTIHRKTQSTQTIHRTTQLTTWEDSL